LQAVNRAVVLARLSSGSNRAARIPMIAETTTSWVKVKPRELAVALIRSYKVLKLTGSARDPRTCDDGDSPRVRDVSFPS
jgi:hypothetical protein